MRMAQHAERHNGIRLEVTVQTLDPISHKLLSEDEHAREDVRKELEICAERIKLCLSVLYESRRKDDGEFAGKFSSL